jgi:hypothetical protein
MKQHKRLWAALPVLLTTALLTGCPQSRLPDTPPIVPQPKASLAMALPSGEIF